MLYLTETEEQELINLMSDYYDNHDAKGVGRPWIEVQEMVFQELKNNRWEEDAIKNSFKKVLKL